MTNRPEKPELVRYLLDDVPQKRREEIELAYMEDDALFREMLAVERELILSYLRDELGTHDKRRFEVSLQNSPLRRKAVETVLASITESGTTSALPPLKLIGLNGLWKSVLLVISIQSPAVRRMMLVLAAAGFLVLGWVLWDNTVLRRNVDQSRSLEAERLKSEADLRSQIATRDARILQLERDLEEERRVRDSMETRFRTLPQASPLFISARLSPGPGDAAALARSLDSIPAIRVTSNIQFVRFELQLDPADDYPVYSVELRDQTRQIKTWSGIRSMDNRGDLFLKLTVTSDILTGASYTILVSGMRDSVSEVIANYRFNVIRQAQSKKNR